MVKIIPAIALIFNVQLVMAGPAQLDILGLLPGVSEAVDVRRAGMDPSSTSDEVVRLEIGGHAIPCATSYIDRKLASLGCLTGKGTGRYQTFTEASNTSVYSDLLSGFSKKFGKPDSISKEPVRTRLGVEHVINIATWVDKHGNRLQLVSMVDVVTAGMITFESAEYLRRQAAESAAAESKKKF